MAYHSGHYVMYGIDCQACVSADLHFIYFGVVAPEATNNNIAFPSSLGLKEFFDSLPTGYYEVADATYTLTEHVVVPFTGSQQLDPVQDAFNYYLSQLRIHVEMEFGRLVNKFHILSGKITGSFDRVTSILTASARQHKFIIAEDGPFGIDRFASVAEEMQSLSISPHSSAPLGMSYLPIVPDITFECIPGLSHTWQTIVEHLCEHQIDRPAHNIERQRGEMEAERAAAER
ncbi:hypothetical protein ACHAW6_007720 [Cyclotella cf. meneghiniana]